MDIFYTVKDDKKEKSQSITITVYRPIEPIETVYYSNQVDTYHVEQEFYCADKSEEVQTLVDIIEEHLDNLYTDIVQMIEGKPC